MTQAAAEQPSRVRRRLRVLAILDAAGDAGIIPVPALHLHTLAYFADALAPVWGLRILDAQLLKRRGGPLSPALQGDVDALVGRGIVVPSGVRHVRDGKNSWRLDASYRLNEEFSSRILETAGLFEQQARDLRFVHEVVSAVSGLGLEGIATAPSSDAAYSDVLIDFGGLLDIGRDALHPNRSAEVAARFGDLMRPATHLTSAEMVHLYVRELYSRLGRAA